MGVKPLVKIEGFDWINTVATAYPGGAGVGVSGTATTSTSTRFNTGRCLSFAGGNTNGLTIPLGGTFTGGIIGFAYMNSNIATNSWDIVRWHSNSTNDVSLKLRLNSAATLELVDAANSSVCVSTNTLSSNVWYYIEVQYHIADSTTIINEIRVNGISWATKATSSDTLKGSATSPSYIQLKGHNGNSYFDDFYMKRHQSGYYGDMQIVALYPNADGTTTWQGSDGNPTNNWDLVDETTDPDDDTTYVYTTGDNKLETYNVTNLPISPETIYGIELITRARKSGVGNMWMQQHYNAGTATDLTGAALTASYAYYRNVVEENVGKTRFSESNINSMTVGQRSQTGTYPQ